MKTAALGQKARDAVVPVSIGVSILAAVCAVVVGFAVALITPGFGELVIDAIVTEVALETAVLFGSVAVAFFAFARLENWAAIVSTALYLIAVASLLYPVTRIFLPWLYPVLGESIVDSAVGFLAMLVFFGLGIVIAAVCSILGYAVGRRS